MLVSSASPLIFTLFLIPTALTILTIVDAVHSLPPKSRQIIGGEWKRVRESLGLAPLPDILLYTTTATSSSTSLPATEPRVELRRRKRWESSYRGWKTTQRLYFDAEALIEHHIPLSQIQLAFQAMAAEEKEKGLARYNSGARRQKYSAAAGLRKARRGASVNTAGGSV